MIQLSVVPLDKVWWEKRRREDLGDIEGLTESIKDKGVIQPITITPDFRLVAGERRVTAARAAGLTEIPALVREVTDEIDYREIELLENLARKDFTWQEQIRAVAELDALCKEKNLDWSGRKTAQLLNKSKSQVARELELADALEVVPELSQLDSPTEAYKALKKLEENVIIKELRERQKEAVASSGLEKGIAAMLKVADQNYRIGDTFKGLAELRSNGHIHIIECDPPYGIDLTEVKMLHTEVQERELSRYQEIPADQYEDFLNRLAKELYRVAGQNCWLVFWFGPSWHSEVKRALSAAGWKVDDIPAIWAKPAGQCQQPEIYLSRNYEPFFLARKGAPVLVKRGRSNIFEFTPVAAQKKYHPTERPVALMQEVLETLGVPLQVVLVPFIGSGATLRAAYNCGMSAFGWDINPIYKDRFMLEIQNDARQLSGKTDED